jgi:hypothetical protein
VPALRRTAAFLHVLERIRTADALDRLVAGRRLLDMAVLFVALGFVMFGDDTSAGAAAWAAACS